jgi:hypothetical protein
MKMGSLKLYDDFKKPAFRHTTERVISELKDTIKNWTNGQNQKVFHHY